MFFNGEIKNTPLKKTTEERTGVQTLLRNCQSVHYYGEFTIASKQKSV
jgi:hypothetical protein